MATMDDREIIYLDSESGNEARVFKRDHFGFETEVIELLTSSPQPQLLRSASPRNLPKTLPEEPQYRQQDHLQQSSRTPQRAQESSPCRVSPRNADAIANSSSPLGLSVHDTLPSRRKISAIDSSPVQSNRTVRTPDDSDDNLFTLSSPTKGPSGRPEARPTTKATELSQRSPEPQSYRTTRTPHDSDNDLFQLSPPLNSRATAPSDTPMTRSLTPLSRSPIHLSARQSMTMPRMDLSSSPDLNLTCSAALRHRYPESSSPLAEPACRSTTLPVAHIEEDTSTPPDIVEPRTKRARRMPSQKSVKVNADRKKVAHELIVSLCGDTGDWESQLRPALEEHGITVETKPDLKLPGTSLVVRMRHRVQSQWQPDEQLFVPCDPFEEPASECLVLLDYKMFEETIERPVEEQRDFFNRIKTRLPSTTSTPIYLVPGAHNRVHRRTARYNSQIRRHVLSQLSQDELSPLAEPFDFSNAELQLQVALDLKMIYPRSDQDCVEWLANLAIDTAFSRYQTKYMSIGAKTSATGNDAQECAVEALTQVRGITPRQATSLIAHFHTIGSMIGSPQAGILTPTLHGLISDSVRQTIVTLFESTDPDKVI